MISKYAGYRDFVMAGIEKGLWKEANTQRVIHALVGGGIVGGLGGAITGPRDATFGEKIGRIGKGALMGAAVGGAWEGMKGMKGAMNAQKGLK